MASTSHNAMNRVVSTFGGQIEADGEMWRLLSYYDGELRTVSSHPSREAAEAALSEMNESANRHDERKLQP
jgi:hypothetical protein